MTINDSQIDDMVGDKHDNYDNQIGPLIGGEIRSEGGLRVV